jgi:hypothetical protein
MWMIEGSRSLRAVAHRWFIGRNLKPLKAALKVGCSYSRSAASLSTSVQGEGIHESGDFVDHRRRGVDERKDPAFDFIAGNRPVTEDQVRQKLVSNGWTDVRVVLRGRFFLATASKGGELGALSVDALTGRLRGEDDD